MNYVLGDLDKSLHQDFIKLTKILRHDWRVPESEINAGSLHRFFHSNEFNFTKTFDKVRNHVAWRRQFDFKAAANLDKKTYDEISRNVAVGIYGVDREGRPIGYIKPKNGYPFQALHTLGEKKIIDYQIQMFERLANIVMPMCSEKYKKNINKIVCVIDLQNIEYVRMLTDVSVWKFALKTMNHYRENYPELNFESVVINTNSLITLAWNKLSPYMLQRTIMKFSFYKDNGLEALLKYSDIENIPQEYGGMCKHDIENYPNFWNKAVEKSVKNGVLTR